MRNIGQVGGLFIADLFFVLSWLCLILLVEICWCKKKMTCVANQIVYSGVSIYYCFRTVKKDLSIIGRLPEWLTGQTWNLLAFGRTSSNLVSSAIFLHFLCPFPEAVDRNSRYLLTACSFNISHILYFYSRLFTDGSSSQIPRYLPIFPHIHNMPQFTCGSVFC